MFRIIQLRLRYWWRRFQTSIGICPDCGTAMNRTSTGRMICPNC